MTPVGAAVPPAIAARLRLPLIAAPMLHVSGPDLVTGACRAGVIGAFPTKNARTVDELDAWLGDIRARLADTDGAAAPFCPNLIMRDGRLKDDLACVVRHGAELVITSVGSPAPAVPALHDAGCLVLADVATLRHAEQAIAAGAKLKRPVENQFYGDRAGAFTDPFGHSWHVATHIEDVSPEEMGRRAAALSSPGG